MAAKKTATKKRGAPRKAPDGLGSALYVRATPEMLAALDVWADELGAERGGSVSRADIVREVLQRALIARAKPSKGNAP